VHDAAFRVDTAARDSLLAAIFVAEIGSGRVNRCTSRRTLD